MSGRCGLLLSGQGVFEIVGVLAVGDNDVHFAGESGELSCARVWDYRDAELRDAAVHGGVVLQDEGASAAFERASYDFEGDITAGGVFGAGSRSEHSAFAGGFEVSVELLFEEHAADGCTSGLFVGGLRIYFDFEGASGVKGRDCLFSCGSGRFWSGLGMRCDAGVHQRREAGYCQAGRNSG